MIARVGGVEIAYDDAGTGAPIVFLHAFPLDRRMWTPQAGALAGVARCIAPDYRGLGESGGAGPYTMDRYADDVAALLDLLQIERAGFVGLSMGGYVSFALWRRHRARIRALVLADTRAGADTEEGRARRRELIELARTGGSEAVAAEQIDGLVGKTTRQRNPDLVSAVRRQMAQAPVEGIVGALEAMMARPDSTPDLATIDVPVLIVVGAEDALTGPKEARAMHQAIRGSRLEVLEQAGHLSSVERPAAFNTVLSEFFAGLL